MVVVVVAAVVVAAAVEWMKRIDSDSEKAVEEIARKEREKRER